MPITKEGVLGIFLAYNKIILIRSVLIEGS